METVPHTQAVCRIHIPAAAETDEKDVAFSHDFGQMAFKKIHCSGIKLLYGRLRFKEPFAVRVESTGPFIEMYFSLAGSLGMAFTHSGITTGITRGHHNIFYIPDTEFYIEPEVSDDDNLSVQVQFLPHFFNRFLQSGQPFMNEFTEGVQHQRFSQLSTDALPITPAMYAVLDEMAHCEKEGVIKQLFIEACVLKLLQLQLEQYRDRFSAQPIPANPDTEKLEIARLFIARNLAHAHSLAELARYSGLNEFKLKKGFKELFGSTVFGYLHTRRMEHAKALLRETQLPISEISEQCGYAFAQSFSTAFKKYAGKTPEGFRGS